MSDAEQTDAMPSAAETSSTLGEGVPRTSKKICRICDPAFPADLREQIRVMIVGTPADPTANPPRAAQWVSPVDIAAWLKGRTPPVLVTPAIVKWHQIHHLRVIHQNKRTDAEKAADAVRLQAPPKLVRTSAARNKEAAPAKMPGKVKQAIINAKRDDPLGQAPPLDDDELFDAQTLELDQGPCLELMETGERSEVLDGPAVEDAKLERTALAPSMPNSDLMYLEAVLRENAKTQMSLAIEIRKRPDKKLSQQEALLLISGPAQLVAATAQYRQILAASKGGRFGAPEMMDQKRGLKNLLNSDKTIIPGDVPPPNAEPVGVPIPASEQLATPNATLPVGAEGLPERPSPPPPLPSFTLSDLSSPAAPPSSPRPAVGVDSVAAETVPMSQAVGAGVQSGASPSNTNVVASAPKTGEGKVGATVTPIKKWDGVV
jgi:hypothetical protein